MKRVYVTESGYFDEHGYFRGSGIIGVDSSPRIAVSYLIKKGCFHEGVNVFSSRLVIVYKVLGSTEGYRLTAITPFPSL